jgi:undecaprenyl-diphosphatase
VFVILTQGVVGVWNADALDVAIAGQISHWRNPVLTNVMFVITSLGDSAYLIFIGLLVVVTLAARRAWRPAGVTATVFLLLPIVVSTIKTTFARVRPTADLYSGADAFSFPSGHASNSTLIYGTLALLAFTSLNGKAKWVVSSGLVLLVFLIAFSRVYAGAHWPSDSLAGLALGAGVLAGLSWVLVHPSQTPANPRTTTLVLAGFVLTAPLYAWYALPFAHTFYRALA